MLGIGEFLIVGGAVSAGFGALGAIRVASSKREALMHDALANHGFTIYPEPTFTQRAHAWQQFAWAYQLAGSTQGITWLATATLSGRDAVALEHKQESSKGGAASPTWHTLIHITGLEGLPRLSCSPRTKKQPIRRGSSEVRLARGCEFDQAYSVHASSQHDATMVISPRVREMLWDLRRTRVSLVTGDHGICVMMSRRLTPNLTRTLLNGLTPLLDVQPVRMAA
jgi:hypothetical protein